MPKRDVRRAAQIEAVQTGEVVTPTTDNGLPTPEEQTEAMTPTVHDIEMIDKSIIHMPAQLTIEELLRKRVDGKIIAIRALIQKESQKFEGIGQNDAVLAVISSSDAVFMEVCQLIAKLTNQPLERFAKIVNGVLEEANISTTELLKCVGVLYGMLSPKKAAGK